VAEANDIIILYPQIKATAVNPNGCWDYKGYSETDIREFEYATKYGFQMNATYQLFVQIS